MPVFSISRRQMLATLVLAPSLVAAEDNLLNTNVAFRAVESEQLLLIDIRTPHEWRRTGIPQGAYSIDMDSSSFFDELLVLANKYPERKIALISTTGGRSAYLSRYLARRGVQVYDVTGGVIGKSTSWKSRGLPFRPYQ